MRTCAFEKTVEGKDALAAASEGITHRSLAAEASAQMRLFNVFVRLLLKNVTLVREQPSSLLSARRLD